MAFLILNLGMQSFAPQVMGYAIGDTVQDFKLKNVDGKFLFTKDLTHAKGLVIVFTCNHCPYALKYEDRLNYLNKTYGPKGFPLLAISSSDPVNIPEDSYEGMVKWSKEHNFSFPYLFDEQQSVAKAFGARRTPEAFVLFKEKGKWKLKYRGAIDDNGADPEGVKSHYVEDAINALLSGKSVPVAETKSVGCSIKLRS